MLSRPRERFAKAASSKDFIAAIIVGCTNAGQIDAFQLMAETGAVPASFEAALAELETIVATMERLEALRR